MLKQCFVYALVPPGSRQVSYSAAHSGPRLRPRVTSPAWAHTTSHGLRLTGYREWCLQVEMLLKEVWHLPRVFFNVMTESLGHTYRNNNHDVKIKQSVNTCLLGLRPAGWEKPGWRRYCWMRMTICGWVWDINTLLRCQRKWLSPPAHKCSQTKD